MGVWLVAWAKPLGAQFHTPARRLTSRERCLSCILVGDQKQLLGKLLKAQESPRLGAHSRVFLCRFCRGALYRDEKRKYSSSG